MLDAERNRVFESWIGAHKAILFKVARVYGALAWRRKERRHSQGRQDIEAATALLIAPSGRDPRLEWIYERIAEFDEANRSLALLMLDGFSYREMSQIKPDSSGKIPITVILNWQERLNARAH